MLLEIRANPVIEKTRSSWLKDLTFFLIEDLDESGIQAGAGIEAALKGADSDTCKSMEKCLNQVF